ncbi:DedA family protein [Ferroacidibacillus organovorans]|uniref:VTT domain-containing protein n=1 Tax=Ferroacidibacillus organovorans TaxID=1765683 RepID=A0A101XP26_9BACL|nr:DedA family protein [Ferroacidibacillus organovorans]KUO94811.1 hypothetical protein ATW55_10390 [Ferroacidibacillus organovorans]
MSAHTILTHYGYLGVFVGLILEFIFIPFPAETTLVISGVMWHQGDFKLIPLIIAATIGSFVGSVIAYLIGFFLGRPLLLRVGKLIRLTEEKLNRFEDIFKRYSIPILLFGRFIAGVRVIIVYIAGINKMKPWIFVVISLISTAIWVIAFILLGATIGTEWKALVHLFFAHPILFILGVLILIAGYIFLHRAGNKLGTKKKNEVTANRQ